MTTDPEEGHKQAQAMQPAPFKVGDKVRLMAGTQVMTVKALEDYGNLVVCEYNHSMTCSARSLVRVEEPTNIAG